MKMKMGVVFQQQGRPMDDKQISRRNYLKLIGAGAAVAASPKSMFALTGTAESTQQPKPPAESPDVIADRARRMKWWHEPKFGMFIHWGLYSVLGRHEWVVQIEGIPATEYQELAKRFNPKPKAP